MSEPQPTDPAPSIDPAPSTDSPSTDSPSSSGPTPGPAARRARLRALLAEQGLDALLVTDLLNIRYLTGFTGSNAALLVGVEGGRDPECGTLLCTDGRYETQAAEEVPDVPLLIERPCDLALVARASGFVGIEEESVTIAAHRRLTDVLGGGSSRAVRLRPVSGLVEALRAVKDAAEISALAAACAIADQAMAELLEAGGIRTGRTEREVGLELDQRMRLLGATAPSFDTIVAAGANSAIPHHQPTDTVLRVGDLVKFDFGAESAGYHSDMTRTVVLGPPADWQTEMYALVALSQQAGREAARIGVSGAVVDAAARSVIVAAGYGEQFVHGLGHGIGLQIHEAPSLAAGSAAIMDADMCVTVEPGVYLPGRGGVRIEDSGVIRPDGYSVLTMTTKDLLVL